MKIDVHELFQRIVQYEDREAYNLFFDYYYPRLIRFSMIFVKQHASAEEVVSEVLIKIFKKRKKLASISNLEGYLFIATKNQSLKFLHKENKQNASVNFMEDEADYILPTYQSPETELLNKELNMVIREAVDTLPPKRRMIFRFIKEEGLRYKDVAKLMDISIKTVEVHMGLALRDLDASLTAYQQGTHKAVPIRKIQK